MADSQISAVMMLSGKQILSLMFAGTAMGQEKILAHVQLLGGPLTYLVSLYFGFFAKKQC
jgi:hypothetical protein